MTRFEVIIPSFRDLRILDAIESVNRQDFDRGGVRVSVVDGGSSADFCRQVQERLRSHDRLVSELDRGIFDAINKGIDSADAEILAVLGSDDRFRTPAALSALDRAFGQGVDYCVAGTVYTSEQWVPRRAWPPTLPTRRNLILGRQVSHFAFFATPRVYRKVGHFDVRFRTAADYEFFWRVAESRELVGTSIPDYLVDMRLGGNSSKSIRNILSGNREIFEALSARLRFPLLPLALKPVWKTAEVLRAATVGRSILQTG